MTKEKPVKNDKLNLRMDLQHTFEFNCYPGISCFTQCCRDITIVLTPYDVLRLKNALGISSDQFLDRYTIIIPKNKLIPLIALKMNETDKKCPFVSSDGCMVYKDRPWPCRMYPLDINKDGTYSLITDTSRCSGLKETKIWKISDWLVDQEIEPYDEMNKHLFSITIQLQARNLDIDNPKISKMVFMALYNLDKFKDFVFKSTFMDRLEVEPARVNKIKNDESELLKFAFDWLNFGLFGKKVFEVKQPPSETDHADR